MISADTEQLTQRLRDWARATFRFVETREPSPETVGMALKMASILALAAIASRMEGNTEDQHMRALEDKILSMGADA